MKQQNASYKSIKEKLTHFGLKVTQQRIVIYEALMKLTNHPKAEEIYDFILPNNPSISLATVYKTLETFLESGLIKKVSTENDFVRYDVNMDYHNHIYCTNTRELIDFDDRELNELLMVFFEKRNIGNFKIQNIQLQINGEKLNPEQRVDTGN